MGIGRKDTLLLLLNEQIVSTKYEGVAREYNLLLEMMIILKITGLKQDMNELSSLSFPDFGERSQRSLVN